MMSVNLTWDAQFAGKESVKVDLPISFGSLSYAKQEEYAESLFKKELGVDYDPNTCDYSFEVHCEDAVFDCGDGIYEVMPTMWYDVRDYMPEDIILDGGDTKTKTLKVLVAIKSRSTGQYTVRSQTRQRNKYCTSFGDMTWDWGKYAAGVITHWMPLPKAPGFKVPKSD